MWGLSILPIAALAALPCGNAVTLHKRDEPAIFELPIAKSERSQVLVKRDSKVASTALYNVQNFYYMVNITIGTPAQKVSLSLDTGSSDIWVNVPNSTYCAADDDPCSSTGLFHIKDSSTFKMLDYEMNATYVSGFLAAGPYVTDKLVIGDATVKDMEFALANESKNPHNIWLMIGISGTDGILGIGYASGTDAAANLGKEYANLPEALVKSGAIKSAAYSLWLNKFDGTGNLLFGGVNKARYQGELQTVPIVPVYGRYSSLTIALTDLSVKNTDGTKSYKTGLPLAVTLDNGSPLIALPKELVDPIFKEVGVGYSRADSYPYIPCNMKKADYNVTFSFSGATVSIPLKELIFENYAEADFPEGTCIFGITYSDPGVNLMGDTFLRSAYVVYDLANNEISLANTDYDGGDDDIYEIGTGTAPVPDATLVPTAITSATGNGPNQTDTPSGSLSSESGETTAYVTATATATGTATGTTENGGASSTSSKGLAAFSMGKPNHLLSGFLGAGLLLAV
ncbi:Peptidase A1 [Penicillium expansum]|uniref:Peptidase A1 n=1 Tax=Penicillium expansum TaxID=27334 RepID=A0A0A2K144_PENEN|nr:Peptidase A1 [Penicillium expansum]KGO61442.1 Peptidase A1 [Penicillium expansum]